MSFNIGLSGIQAASSGLNVTGNNIANAGTVGFKQSRAEFADVYAASVLGSGSNPQGSGVLLSDVSQMFKQGCQTALKSFQVTASKSFQLLKLFSRPFSVV